MEDRFKAALFGGAAALALLLLSKSRSGLSALADCTEDEKKVIEHSKDLLRRAQSAQRAQAAAQLLIRDTEPALVSALSRNDCKTAMRLLHKIHVDYGRFGVHAVDAGDYGKSPWSEEGQPEPFTKDWKLTLQREIDKLVKRAEDDFPQVCRLIPRESEEARRQREEITGRRIPTEFLTRRVRDLQREVRKLEEEKLEMKTRLRREEWERIEERRQMRSKARVREAQKKTKEYVYSQPRRVFLPKEDRYENE